MFKSQGINKVHNHFKQLNTSYLVAISNVFKSQGINEVHNHFKQLNTSYVVAISNVLRVKVLRKFTILLNS